MIVGQQFETRDIILQNHNDQLKPISELYRSYDALQYSLIFWIDGYSIDIPQYDPTTTRFLKRTVSASSFYAYRNMIREGEGNYLLRYDTLFNQYLVYMYAKIETKKLHQKELRADNYIHLKDTIGRQDVQSNQLGKVVVLPILFHWRSMLHA